MFNYQVFEITQQGTLKRISNVEFNTLEEAEKYIIASEHPMNRIKMTALKVFS